jgi:hypothetical protein
MSAIAIEASKATNACKPKALRTPMWRRSTKVNSTERARKMKCFTYPVGRSAPFAPLVLTFF